MAVQVLLYVPSLQAGGTEKRVERIATGLDPRRFRATVAWSHEWGPVGERLQAAGIAVKHLPIQQPEQAALEIQSLNPEIFHSFSYHKTAADTLAAHQAGVPRIITSRVGTREWDSDLRVKEWELIRNRDTHRITAVSEAAAALCEKIEGAAPQNIVVIRSGLVLPPRSDSSPTVRDELGLAPDRELLGYVAHFRPEKAHEDLLRAFRLILDRRPSAHLVCCGLAAPEVRQRLCQMVRDLGLEAHISLLEFRQDVDRIYRGLNLYLHASRFEGLPNSILEAMSYALPVVATAVGGTPEAVAEGVSGLLVPPQDPQALADAAVELLQDPGRLREFGSAGRERVGREFSLSSMLAALERLYADVCGAGIQPKPLPAARGRRIRILFHLDYLWLGGLERRVANTILALDRRRFEPVLSWGQRCGAAGEAVARAGIPVLQISPAHARTAAIEQIRELAPDIFHSFSYRRSSADVLNARAAGVPRVITTRGSIRETADPPQAWEQERNQWTDVVVAGSEAIAASIRGEGLTPDRIRVIRNGVKPAAPVPIRDEVRCFGYAATYRALKGHEILLRAFRGLAARCPGIRLLCCGEQKDDTKARLLALVREWGLEEKVQLLDAQEQMEAMYGQMDVYVHPSFTEGFSNAILEAMAHGLPVIASAVGGNPEAVEDGITGDLVPPGEVESLETAMWKMMQDAPRRRRLARAGYDRAACFSLEAMVSAHETMYQELMAQRILEPRTAAAAD